jgi:hypothetical protein
MSNLSDKELDRLSREAADFYEPDDSSLTWSRLEQKLIEQMPERPPDGFRFGRINPYVWGSAVVLVASVSFFMIKNNSYSKYSTRTNQPVTQATEIYKDNTKPVKNNTLQLDSLSSTGRSQSLSGNASSKESSRKSLSSTDKISPATPAYKRNANVPVRIIKGIQARTELSESGNIKTGNRTATQTAKKYSTAEPGKNNISRRKNSIAAALLGSSTLATSSSLNTQTVAKSHATQTKNPASELSGNDAQTDPFSMDVSQNSNANSSTNAKNKKTHNLPLLAPSGFSIGRIAGNDSLLNAKAKSFKPVSRSLHLDRSLNFGFTFGPDYTDAGGIANNQLGNNIGLTIGYYLTSKLSLNTGIIYSNKFYWSPRRSPSPQLIYLGGPQQYYGNPNARTAPPPIEYVNGAADIWEMPLSLRYDFAKNSKSKFFVSAGVSSYFIVNQTSIYFSHNGYNPVAWKRTNDEHINYWFDVADFSAGIETEIGKGFSFQFEPYLKLPLKNMGMENLRLNSYGMLISFHYSPVLRRTKK